MTKGKHKMPKDALKRDAAKSRRAL
jgi:hypothetical protein